jgi:hypothetical protein
MTAGLADQANMGMLTLREAGGRKNPGAVPKSTGKSQDLLILYY